MFVRAFLAVSLVLAAGTARAEDAGKSPFLAALSEVIRDFCPVASCEVYERTASGGGVVVAIARMGKGGASKRLAELREYRTVAMNRLQFDALAKGDRVLFFSDDFETFRVISEKLNAMSGPVSFTVKQGEDAWRLKGELSWDKTASTDEAAIFKPRVEFKSLNQTFEEPFNYKFQTIDSYDLKKALTALRRSEASRGLLSPGLIQSDASLTVRLAEDNPLLLRAGARVVTYARTMKGLSVLTAAVVAYEVCSDWCSKAYEYYFPPKSAPRPPRIDAVAQVAPAASPNPPPLPQIDSGLQMLASLKLAPSSPSPTATFAKLPDAGPSGNGSDRARIPPTPLSPKSARLLGESWALPPAALDAVSPHWADDLVASPPLVYRIEVTISAGAPTPSPFASPPAPHP